jgi:hypothetical protein
MTHTIRNRLSAALAKPVPSTSFDIGDPTYFHPWNDVIDGIYGSYASKSDDYMLITLEAVRDRTTFDAIEEHGFIVEFMLYVLAGHGLTEYGTSPRGGFPDPDIADLWPLLIDMWKAYSAVAWSSEPTT